MVASSIITGQYSWKYASRSVDSTHTLEAIPAISRVEMPRLRSNASSGVPAKPLYRDFVITGSDRAGASASTIWKSHAPMVSSLLRSSGRSLIRHSASSLRWFWESCPPAWAGERILHDDQQDGGVLPIDFERLRARRQGDLHAGRIISR